MPTETTVSSSNETIPIYGCYISYPATEVTKVVVPSLYNTISFNGLPNLQTITFSDTRQSNLTEIYWSGFSNLKYLKNVRFNNSIQQIDEQAFSGCEALETIDFTYCENLYSIDSQAFAGCNKLQPFTLPNSLMHFAIDSLDYSTTAPYAGMYTYEKVADGVNLCYLAKGPNDANKHFIALGYITPTTEGSYEIDLVLDKETVLLSSGFNSCCVDKDSVSVTGYIDINTKSIDFGNNLKCVGAEAFKLNDSYGNVTLNNTIKTLKFPASLREIGTSAFDNFSMSALEDTAHITSVEFNEGLQYIGDCAFNNQHKIKKLEFPSTLIQIGVFLDDYVGVREYGTFCGCYGLESITFAQNSQLKYIGDYTFYKLNKSSENATSKEMDFKLPDTVEKIGEKAFLNSFYPTNGFKIPTSCKYLGTLSLWFYNYACSSIQEQRDPIDIVIPESVEYMVSPFGYTFDGVDHSKAIASVSTLSFADKSSKWEISLVDKRVTPYTKDITLTADGKLEQDDYDKFMGGSKWTYEQTEFYPFKFEWNKKS